LQAGGPWSNSRIDVEKIVKDPFATDKPAVALPELSDHHNHTDSSVEMTDGMGPALLLSSSFRARPALSVVEWVEESDRSPPPAIESISFGIE
jgi:hypothetical protein